MKILKHIVNFVTKLAWYYQVVGVVVVVLGGLVVAHAFSGSSTTVTAPDVTHVHIASVASLSDQAGPLPVTGKITSMSKASILAVSSGEIVSLNHSLGDRVSAGTVIASFENSGQRAAVMQAQGAYDAAKAALAKASGSTAENTSLSSAQAAQSAQNAATAATAALLSAYAALDDAVHSKADVLFSNPNSEQPQLNLVVADGALVNSVQTQRVSMNPLLESVRGLSSQRASEIDIDITTAIAGAHKVEALLNSILQALNKAITNNSTEASAVATDQASIAAARTAVLGAITSLTNAKSSYDSAVTGAATAQNTSGNGLSNDIASAQANVMSALGALNAAQSNLEKTIIRAPISGTIVSLPITRGGYVSSFTQVAQISNPGALEVEAYVTPDDAKTLAVGGKAKIGDSANGIIVFIAPALDPANGKIQVKVGISGDQSSLTDGDTVTVSLERSTTGGSKTSTKNVITIPIVAAKITPTGPVIFTISSSTLVAVPVTFGPILGGQVTVQSGLTLQMDIVTDARGLSDGQVVVVDSN